MLTRFHLASAAAMFIGALVVGCGSKSSTDGANGDGTGGGTDEGGSGAGGSAGSSGGASGAGGSSGSIGSGGASGSSGGGTDGSVGPGDGAPPGDAPGSTGDAIDETPFNGLPCGTSVCRVGQEVCCHPGLRPGPVQPPPTCTAPSDCTDGGVGAECGGPADCPVGQYCCGTLAANQLSYTSIKCASSCQRQDGGAVEYEFCDPRNSQACHFGGTCQTSQLIAATTVCR